MPNILESDKQMGTIKKTRYTLHLFRQGAQMYSEKNPAYGVNIYYVSLMFGFWLVS